MVARNLLKKRRKVIFALHLFEVTHKSESGGIGRRARLRI